MAELQTRNWTQLPPDLLQVIAGHLTELPDRLRFRSVCFRWRSSPIPQNFPQQFPWLLLPSNDGAPSQPDHYSDGTVRFLSLSENTTYTIPLPQFRNHRIFPSPPNGWLIAVLHKFSKLDVEFFISLVNPVTHFSIPLPPLSLTETRWAPPDPLPNVKLFGSSIVVDDLVVAFHDRHRPGMFFCRPGETTWRKIDMAFNYEYGDFILHNGSFFVFNLLSELTHVYNVKSFEKISDIGPVWGTGHEISHYNLAQSPSGELLLVRRWRNTFKLFKLDESEQPLKWVKVGSIGEDVLFKSASHSMFFASSDFKGCSRGNCIYFLDDNWPMKRSRSDEASRLWLFDLEEGQVDREPIYKLKWSFAKWFIPSLG